MADQTKRVAIIASSYGVEADELLTPKGYLESAGYEVVVATPDSQTIQTLVSDKDPGPTVRADAALAELSPSDFDLLVIPGGTINADTLRLQEDARRIAEGFAASGKPIAAICHGPWLVVETGLARGKTLTSYPSLRTDITNAGGNWVDRSVEVDDAQGFTLITSRTPGDLTDFDAAIGEVLG
ncbi:protease I [Propionibacterium cyclohexanicum]|uniref:Protease I n=1 Tax=Propionibacterium cyclohexanicum TaxID=64702 RepID=A0A1H9TPB7_9ACTN|nr:type 1 glutamine amidotransferase domain-containing protein [Propionibacterium cyclohexanicum]SER98955.1 protease I [Propionibacterium cyclohexanicum]